MQKTEYSQNGIIMHAKQGNVIHWLKAFSAPVPLRDDTVSDHVDLGDKQMVYVQWNRYQQRAVGGQITEFLCIYNRISSW